MKNDSTDHMLHVLKEPLQLARRGYRCFVLRVVPATALALALGIGSSRRAGHTAAPLSTLTPFRTGDAARWGW